MNYRSNSEVERLLSVVRNEDITAPVKVEIESNFSTCRNPSLLQNYQSLDDDALILMLARLKDHFITCCGSCLTAPKTKRGLLLKVKFFDTTFMSGVLSDSKVNCEGTVAGGIFVNIFADAVFNECLRVVQRSFQPDQGTGTKGTEKSRDENSQPHALLAIAGGTLGLCINRLVKLKRRIGNKNLEKKLFYQNVLNFAALFRMSSKEKLMMLRTNCDKHLKFLFYRDRGFLHIPKLEMLKLINKINDEVHYNFANDIFSVSCSKTLQHIWNEVTGKKEELFQEFIGLAGVLAGSTVDKEVAQYFFHMFLTKFCHASMNEHFRNMKIAVFDKKGRRCRGGISLREKLYASTSLKL